MATVFVEIRMLKDMPAVIGTDMNTYGPFFKDRVYAIPKENARLFIKQGLALATRKEAEKPTLKEMFKGEVLTPYVEASLVKPLVEPSVNEEKRKVLLRRSEELIKEIQETRKT